MAKQTKIRNVTVHYPTKENEEEFQRRAARAVSKVICEIYPPEVIDQVIERLKKDRD